MHPKQQFVFLLLLVLTQVSGCGGGRSAVSGGSAVNQLGGTIKTANFVVPAGVTRTITSNLIVNASFGIEIDGTLNMEPGVSVALISQGTITIKGTLQPTPGRVAKAVRTSRGTRETRDTPAVTYLVISGKDVGVSAASSKLQQGGITTVSGQDIYITTADKFGQVFISSTLETADGENGTNASLSANGVYTSATDGTAASSIHIGDSLAIAEVQRIANVTTAAPGSVIISGTIKTGNGGNGGSDLTGGADPKSGWIAQSGSGGSGGSLAMEVAPGNISIKSDAITLGHGGGAGDIGTAANPVGPLPRKAASVATAACWQPPTR